MEGALLNPVESYPCSVSPEALSTVVALQFSRNVNEGFVAVLESLDLEWWTFGGDYENDGSYEVLGVVEHLVLHGGPSTACDAGPNFWTWPAPVSMYPPRWRTDTPHLNRGVLALVIALKCGRTGSSV